VSDETVTQSGRGWLSGGQGPTSQKVGLGLVLAWSSSEPWRVGEVALLPASGERVLGRGLPLDDDRAPRVRFAPHRPGPRADGGWLSNPGLSRQQLLLRMQPGHISLERIGRVATRVRGLTVEQADVEAGDVVVVDRELVLACIEVDSSAYGGSAAPAFGFGEGGALGLVGESARIWSLRDELDFYAKRNGHVLVVGPSGAGKELCARAIHARSSRHSGPFVARNAATLPAGIIDAELFGNAKNYPNPGMRERAGLIGEADGGTLFLDEIGELPESLQAHLLRVLDAGEYHRLGEDAARRADVRLVAATNRDPSALKHDLIARLKLRVEAPGLEERREDIPLLIRSILRHLAETDSQVAKRFFEEGEPRVDPELVVALLEHTYTAHVRELESLLLLAMAGSNADYVAHSAGVKKRLVPLERPRKAPDAAEIESVLTRLNGNVSRAYQELGLPSRDALNRLLKKHGIVVRRS
jgi:hypothetical protein